MHLPGCPWHNSMVHLPHHLKLEHEVIPGSLNTMILACISYSIDMHKGTEEQPVGTSIV